MSTNASTTPLYCKRDSDGNVIATTREAVTPEQLLSGEWQPIAPNDDQLKRYLYGDAWAANLLATTDTGLARVLEDVVDALITRGVIQFTDLPEAAQAKLLERRQSRANLGSRLQIMPVGNDDAGLI